MKRIFQLILPPILVIAYDKLVSAFANLRNLGKDKLLFEGSDSLFKESVFKASVYGEYGVGVSTQWVFENTKIPIYGVDTSEQWINHVKAKINLNSRVELNWVNLGELGDWGRPLTYDQRDKFKDYIESIWRYPKSKPDVVLIDGRFRVACMLYSLLEGEPGSKIFFDDYVNRPHYYIVEEFVKPTKISGRQAMFIVPNILNKVGIEKLLDKFIYVWD